jgi:hypothetical protein
MPPPEQRIAPAEPALERGFSDARCSGALNKAG